MRETNYELRLARAEEYYGYETPGAVLRAAAEFSDQHDDAVYAVSLRWTPESGYGITVLWEQ